MAVASPEHITAAFQTAYNARDKAALLRLYAPDAVHTFDGLAISSGVDAISLAFDRGFAGSLNLHGETLSCMVAGNTAMLRVLWRVLDPDGVVRLENVSCEVVGRGADGLWRYLIDDASGGSRPARG